jgi:hypothetical protein
LHWFIFLNQLSRVLNAEVSDRACQSLGGRLRQSFSAGARARHNRRSAELLELVK